MNEKPLSRGENFRLAAALSSHGADCHPTGIHLGTALQPNYRAICCLSRSNVVQDLPVGTTTAQTKTPATGCFTGQSGVGDGGRTHTIPPVGTTVAQSKTLSKGCFTDPIRGGRWGSNPQHLHPQCSALPLSYAHHKRQDSITAFFLMQAIDEWPAKYQ